MSATCSRSSAKSHCEPRSQALRAAPNENLASTSMNHAVCVRGTFYSDLVEASDSLRYCSMRVLAVGAKETVHQSRTQMRAAADMISIAFRRAHPSQTPWRSPRGMCCTKELYVSMPSWIKSGPGKTSENPRIGLSLAAVARLEIIANMEEELRLSAGAR